MKLNKKYERTRTSAANTGLAKVAVQCSSDTFVVNQSLVLRINICSENRHLRQAPNRCVQCIGQSIIDKKLGKYYLYNRNYK
ncbi:MAG: hypothetical protein RL115_201 [Bacteroidota bacterium]|jgi:hypothetical protein